MHLHCATTYKRQKEHLKQLEEIKPKTQMLTLSNFTLNTYLIIKHNLQKLDGNPVP